MDGRVNDDDADQLQTALADYGGGSVLRVETRDGITTVLVRTYTRSLIRVIVLEVREDDRHTREVRQGTRPDAGIL
jgi:hypothetical protein